MADLSVSESKKIAEFWKVITILEMERNRAIQDKNNAENELKEIKNNIDDLASKAAEKVWAKERKILLSKIDRLERKARSGKRQVR